MNNYYHWIIILCLISPPSWANKQCSSLTLVEGQARYNQLVCQGLSELEEKRYPKAVQLLEQALSIPLFEIPNFKLLPQLALAYKKAGDHERSKNTLEKAKLSLSVFVGILFCEETDSGYVLKDPNNQVLSNHGQLAVASIMCGAAYDYLYQRDSLERVLIEAELVKNYFEIISLVQSS